MEERCPIPETVVARVHLKSMGRDEMNLVEFPLTTLADRAPRGCKTLVFEDRILDRGCNQERVRRLEALADGLACSIVAVQEPILNPGFSLFSGNLPCIHKKNKYTIS